MLTVLRDTFFIQSLCLECLIRLAIQGHHSLLVYIWFFIFLYLKLVRLSLLFYENTMLHVINQTWYRTLLIGLLDFKFCLYLKDLNNQWILLYVVFRCLVISNIKFLMLTLNWHEPLAWIQNVHVCIQHVFVYIYRYYLLYKTLAVINYILQLYWYEK